MVAHAHLRLLYALAHGYTLVDTGPALVLRRGRHQRGVRVWTIREFSDRLAVGLELLRREDTRA